MNITIKYSETERVLFLILDYGSCFLYLLPTLLVITSPIFLLSLHLHVQGVSQLLKQSDWAQIQDFK